MAVDLVHCNLVGSLCVCSLVPNFPTSHAGLSPRLLSLAAVQLFLLQAKKAWEISLGTRLVRVYVYVYIDNRTTEKGLETGNFFTGVTSSTRFFPQ